MRKERSLIISHTTTVLVGQLAVMAFGITDTIVAGRHAPESLAALSIGSAIFISVYVALMGILQALLPVWSELRGAQEPAQIGASLRQSLYLWLAASVLGMWIMLAPDAILRSTQIPEALRGDVRHYLAILAYGLPPVLLFRLYATLNQALGRPQLVTWLQVGALMLKVPLSIWFTFGGGSMPEQGAAGCAWATLLVNYGLLLFGCAMLRTQSLYTPLKLWQRMERPDWAQLARFLRLGLPAGLSIMVEVTSITVMALFIARQGVLAAGANQIASNMVAVLYMVPLSLAIATSARVSFWRGAGNEAQAACIAKMGLRLTLYTSGVLAAAVVLARQPIAALYSTHADVVQLAAALLVPVALWHVADAAQTLCIFVLRSYRITIVPLVVYGTLLWGVGLAGGYILAYQGVGWGSWSLTPLNSPTPFWYAGSLALTLVALIFYTLLGYALRQVITPKKSI